MCHNPSVCGLTDKKQGRRKRATDAPVNSGSATYGVASTNNRLVNTPPRITSTPDVEVFEDDMFQFRISAEDSEDDPLSFLLNETVPVSMGNVSLALDGMLTYTPCADCYGEDTVYFTVWEQRTDDEPALFVEGKLLVKIRNTPDSPTLQMFNGGRDVILPSSVTMVTMEENSGKNSASPDMVYILAAYDPDYTDDVSLKFDPPQHGNLTLYRQVKIVNLIDQDCSQPWDTRRPLWDKITEVISSSATMTEVSLPNPCGMDLVTRKLAWVVTMFKYRPFEGYFGEDVIKVRHILCSPTNRLRFMPSCLMWSDLMVMVYAILFNVVRLDGYGLCHPV